MHLISGLINFVSGLNELAQTDYLRAIALQRNNGEAYRRLGKVYEKIGRLNEALAEFHQAVEVEPGRATYRLVLANFYFQRGDYQEALPHYRKAVELAPKSSVSHNALGADLGELGQFAEAEKELLESIALKDSFDAELALGTILLDAGKNPEAISRFERAKAIGPENGGLWLDLGLAYSRQHRDREMKSAFLKGQKFSLQYLSTDLTYPVERARLAYFDAKLGEPLQAKSEIDQVLQIPRNDLEIVLLSLLTFEALDLRERSLGLLAGSSPVLVRSLIVQAERYPELADLRQDSRYPK